MTVPLLYIHGDDELLASRLVDRFALALATELGMPLERSEVLAEFTTAGVLAGRLLERMATPVMFGGGSLAIVSNPGALLRSNASRETILRAVELIAPGNALVFIEATKSNARGPASRRLADAVVAAGGRLAAAMAPRPSAIGAWIETEARERGLRLAPGAARELAERLGSRVTDGDVERRHLTRIASMELDKLDLLRSVDGRPVSPDDVRNLVAQTTPGSVWGLTDAVGERQRGRALQALDRLIEATPEPVILAVLHRRIVELLELGDRLASGAPLPVAARAMGITNEYRARTMSAQARNWTTLELQAALEGLLDLDAMVKGVRGSELDLAQRRLAFTLWVGDHIGQGGRSGRAQRA